MANYIRLPQSTHSLPLLDKEWLFISPSNIIRTSIFGKVIYNNLSLQDKIRVDFPKVVKETGSYPRFDITDSMYKIVRNELNILPTGRTNDSISTITDNRAIELLNKSSNYEKIYLFYSGGIDSTTIVSAILKNWSKADLDKVCIVLNEYSIVEYLYFYETYIKDKIKTIDTNLFFSGSMKVNENNMYVTGYCGNPIFTYDNILTYDNRFPNTYSLPWKNNKHHIITYFGHEYAELAFSKIEQSIPYHLDTVYDFLWWFNFNQGYDIDLYYFISLSCDLDPIVDTKRFLLNNMFIWYNNLDYQNWTMYSPFDMKIEGNLVKLPLKKYILDFTKDTDYYVNKRIEPSISKNTYLFKRWIIGVDVDYNIYYRDLIKK